MATKACLGLILGLGLLACEASPQQQLSTGMSEGPQGATSPGTGQSNVPVSTIGSAGQGTSASIPITLSEKTLQNYGLDTTALSFHFHYLAADLSAPIPFISGTAHLIIPGVPSGQTGDLTLEVLQAGTVKMRGVLPGVSLSPGQAHLALTLEPVTTTGPGTGSLTINTSVDPTASSAGTSVASAPTTPVPVSPIPSGPSQPGGSNPPFTGGSQPSNPNAPSFARDVAPILNRACAECHHPGGQAPDLTAQPQGATVDKILQIAGPNGQMPPGPRDHLSQDDLTTISNWRSSGLNP